MKGLDHDAWPSKQPILSNGLSEPQGYQDTQLSLSYDLSYGLCDFEACWFTHCAVGSTKPTYSPHSFQDTNRAQTHQHGWSQCLPLSIHFTPSLWSICEPYTLLCELGGGEDVVPKCKIWVWCMPMILAPRSMRQEDCCEFKTKLDHIVRLCVMISIDLCDFYWWFIYDWYWSYVMYRVWNHLRDKSLGMSIKEFVDQVIWGGVIAWNGNDIIAWPGILDCIKRRKLIEQHRSSLPASWLWVQGDSCLMLLSPWRTVPSNHEPK